MKAAVTLPRLPRTAAVAVTAPTGCGLTYPEVMRRARGKISLADVGVGKVRARRVVTGAILLQIPGEGGAEKAEKLRGKMEEVFRDTGVVVARPVKSAELRVAGLDDSVTSAEVAEAVAKAGGCRVSEVVSGAVRLSPSGLGTAWVRCPLAAARKVAAAGRILVGWVSAPVQTLAPRPVQCYRCLERGHVSARCTGEVNRSGACYRCGDHGHKAAECGRPVRCVVCAEAGRPAGHRAGGAACPIPARKKKVAKKSSGGEVHAPPNASQAAQPASPGDGAGESPAEVRLEGAMDTA